MSLHDILARIKPRASQEVIGFSESVEVEKGQIFKKLFLSLVILLVATLSFGIGRLTSPGAGEPVKIEYDPSLAQGNQSAQEAPISATITAPEAGSVVASSKGSRYYYANCSGASRISTANRVSFASASLAEASGYTLASGCKP